MATSSIVEPHQISCDDAVDALSALADGEDPGLPRAVVDAHVAGCESCRRFQSQLDDVVVPFTTPSPVVAVAGPDESQRFVEKVVAEAGTVDRSGVWWMLRALLAAVAVGYLLIAVPGMLLSTDVHHGHISHHLGIFSTAYAVTLLFVAVRPSRARALVPFTVVMAVGMVAFAVVDVMDGEAFALSEMSHLLELAGLVLVWLLATRRGWPGRAPLQAETSPAAGPASAASRPSLQVVKDDPAGPSQRAS